MSSQAEEPKKEKRKAFKPECPSEVATAYLVVRGAALGVIGASMNEVSVGGFQPTFIKDKTSTGKFTIDLGKKDGSGQLKVTPSVEEPLLDAVEKAANRLIQESLSVDTIQLSKQDAIDKFGAGAMDDTHKKVKPNDPPVTLASIAGVVLAVPPGIPYASSSSISEIKIDRKASSVGKKGKKTNMSLKFQVVGGDGDVAMASPVEIDTSALLEANVRMPEGQALLDSQKEAEAKEEEERKQAEAAAREEQARQEAAEKKAQQDAAAAQAATEAAVMQGDDAAKLMDATLLERLKRHTKPDKLHHWLTRNILFSHRDLDTLLDCVEKNVPFYLFCSHLPGKTMNVGELLHFSFIKWLQDAFDCPLVIQIKDDELFYKEGKYDEEAGYNLDDYRNMAKATTSDLAAIGFDSSKTFIYSNYDYFGTMYPNICRTRRSVATGIVNELFGFDGSTNVGEVASPAVQAAASIASSYPNVLTASRKTNMACLVACTIDQDACFRMTRSVALKLTFRGHPLNGKPAMALVKDLPHLQGRPGSTSENSMILVTDSAEAIAKKVKEQAYSGGQDTEALQREHGADLEEDVPFKYLYYILDDDEELERIKDEYGSGKGEYWCTSKVKGRLIEILQQRIAEHQERRAQVTDEVQGEFTKQRCITANAGEDVVMLHTDQDEEPVQNDIEEVTQKVAGAQVAKDDGMSVEKDGGDTGTPKGNDVGFTVNVEKVEGIVDYDKLVDQFGSKKIDINLKERLRACLKPGVKLHPWLERDIFFSHRDLPKFVECVEKGQTVYLYTGRGPSSASMHTGHLIPFLFTQWLQEAFDCPLVIQMTDDEKFLFKGKYDKNKGDNLEEFHDLTMQNARDILACGFNRERTFIFSDLDYIGTMYPNITRISKAVTANTAKGMFGFDDNDNIGKLSFGPVQAAPSFASSFPTALGASQDSDMPCLIPCAIDQDPYFRMTRDVAPKLVPSTHPLAGKPALIHSKFFPPLQGAAGKMSSSDENSAIFLTDTAEEIARKINEHAKTGEQETEALQREHGANLEDDVPYQWLRFFLLDDEEEYQRIGQEYSTGTGEYWCAKKVKERLIEILQKLVGGHQARHAEITDDVLQSIMQDRSIL